MSNFVKPCPFCLSPPQTSLHIRRTPWGHGPFASLVRAPWPRCSWALQHWQNEREKKSVTGWNWDGPVVEIWWELLKGHKKLYNKHSPGIEYDYFVLGVIFFANKVKWASSFSASGGISLTHSDCTLSILGHACFVTATVLSLPLPVAARCKHSDLHFQYPKPQLFLPIFRYMCLTWCAPCALIPRWSWPPTSAPALKHHSATQSVGVKRLCEISSNSNSRGGVHYLEVRVRLPVVSLRSHFHAHIVAHYWFPHLWW